MSVEIDAFSASSSKEKKYSIGTLVTNFDEYNAMLETFVQKGFSERNSDFFYIDNTMGNKEFPYKGYNRILNMAQGDYVILCHQDIRLHADDFDTLSMRLAELDHMDPKWAIAGNAGGIDFGDVAINISHPNRTVRIGDVFPAQVFSLDENFLIIRNNTRVAFSHDLDLFHFYGTDICLHADLMGHTAYVIDFLLTHLSLGTKDARFFEARNIFEKKWEQALRARKIQTTCTRTFLNGAPVLNENSEAAQSTKRKHIFQIYHRNDPPNTVSHRYIPLDITDSPRPDWQEFHAVSHFLKNTQLDPDCFYGFLAPDMSVEIKLHPQNLINIIDQASPDVDAIVISTFDSYNPLFKNQFLQIDNQHEGVMKGLKEFFNASGFSFDLENSITTITSSCYSTHIVAKPSFWREWLAIADHLFNYVEANAAEGGIFNKEVARATGGEVRLKVLIQRMLATVVLISTKLHTLVPEEIRTFQEFEPSNQKILFQLEALKQFFTLSGDPKFLQTYEGALAEIWPDNGSGERTTPSKNLISS